MKPYVVFRYDADRVHDGVPGAGVLRFLAWSQPQEESDGNNFDGSHSAYFLETEADANTLANLLATRRPGTAWVVAKSASSFRSTPGPVAKAVFSDQGLLPAN